MRRYLFQGVALLTSVSLVMPYPGFAQAPQADQAPPGQMAPQGDQTAQQPGQGGQYAGQQASTAQGYSQAQLDALLAPIALYPDALLAQVLMASTYPLQVIEAARWLDAPGNKALTGNALATALQAQSWDPSVKSLVPFPQIIAQMNSKLDWMQQLGYAFSVQQNDVMDAVQRLRQQAQAAGQLQTTQQQKVIVEKQTIVIEPADPAVVYVPTYNPTVVYGAWQYPAYPPVYIPPPPGYVIGSALMTGLAFAAGVAVVGSLWGWARPVWGYGGGYGGYGRYGGSININTYNYNNINVNRPPINNGTWRPPPGGPGGGGWRPPGGGPVGAPTRPVTMPAGMGPGGMGPRPSVQVPGSLVNGNRPSSGWNGGANRPGANGGGLPPGGGAGEFNRPGANGGGLPPGGQSGFNRPGANGGGLPPSGGQSGFNRPGANGGGLPPGGGQSGLNRPGGGGGGTPPGGNPGGFNRPGGGGGGMPPGGNPGGFNRPGGGGGGRPPGGSPGGSAFGGVNQGAHANQFGNRGAESRSMPAQRPAAAPQRPSGGGGGGGGGERFRRP